MILTNFDFDAALLEAQARGRVMVGNGLYSRFGLPDWKRIDNAVLGCMGEIAFEHFLKQTNLKYELDHTDFTQRNSDEFDFKLKEFKVDIKVAKKTTQNSPNDRWTYGYPEEQRPASKDFVVVGWVDFKEKQVGFYGWMTGTQVGTYKVVTHNSFIGYQYLTPNHEFPWGDLNKDFVNLFARFAQ